MGITKVERAKRLAVHEAGHAIVAAHLRVPVKLVTIEPSEDSLGHAVLRNYESSFQPDIELTHAGRDRLERHIIVLIAGGVAERCYLERPRASVGDHADWSIAIHLDYLNGSSWSIEAYLEWLYRRTVETVTVPRVWSGILTLSSLLLEKRTVKGRAIRKIYRAQRRDIPGDWETTKKLRLLFGARE